MDCSTEYDHGRPYIVLLHPNSPSPQQQSHGSECATHATWCVARPFAPLQITPGAIDMHKRRYALLAI
eukprot:scaffold12389_cov22-Phaeocystis_antarctica.AAC.2